MHIKSRLFHARTKCKRLKASIIFLNISLKAKIGCSLLQKNAPTATKYVPAQFTKMEMKWSVNVVSYSRRVLNVWIKCPAALGRRGHRRSHSVSFYSLPASLCSRTLSSHHHLWLPIMNVLVKVGIMKYCSLMSSHTTRRTKFSVYSCFPWRPSNYEIKQVIQPLRLLRRVSFTYTFHFMRKRTTATAQIGRGNVAIFPFNSIWRLILLTDFVRKSCHSYFFLLHISDSLMFVFSWSDNRTQFCTKQYCRTCGRKCESCWRNNKSGRK